MSRETIEGLPPGDKLRFEIAKHLSELARLQHDDVDNLAQAYIAAGMDLLARKYGAMVTRAWIFDLVDRALPFPANDEYAGGPPAA